MPPKMSNKLTEAEWKIMKIIWDQKSCASRDVVEAAQKSEGWAASTVKTLLRRLVDKGYLKTTQVGNCFVYRPAQSVQSQLRKTVDSLLDIAKEGTMGSIIAYMVRNSNLSATEVTELRNLLDQVDPKMEE